MQCYSLIVQSLPLLSYAVMPCSSWLDKTQRFGCCFTKALMRPLRKVRAPYIVLT